MAKLKSRSFLWLLLILVVAGVLRFYQLGLADVITDEVLIAFRSIGYIDFFSSPYQTTPWEWFSTLPWWLKLSFHDHPPLIFLIQHWFFQLLGQNIIALRLPFALAGIFSVFLLYLIGKNLFNHRVGLLAGLFLAVSSYHVWISRTGLQESIVILLILLTFYFFLKSLKDNSHWQWGIALGLALLSKYTAIVLAPIILVYLLIFNRQVFKDKKLWLALILAILIFSPVLVYNFNLYQARGHFDLQFSYLLGQKVSEWDYLPGKIQAGSFSERLKNLVPALYQGMLWLMFVLGVMSLALAIYRIFREVPRPDNYRDSEHFYFFIEKNRSVFLLILAIFFHLLLFLAIGPSKRFVVMVVPFIILLVAWFIDRQKKLIKYPVVIAVVVLEIFFSANTFLPYYSWGKENLTYSYLKIESYNYGYNQLNNYLVQLLRDKSPAVTFTTRYQFLEEIKKKALVKAEQQGRAEKAILLVYDSDMYDLATFWLFHRLMVYQGWPVVTADTYLGQGEDFWRSQGITDFYFFKILDGKMLLQPAGERTAQAQALSDQLLGLEPEIIKRPDGREVFAAYHWQ